jgi:hypothetical protein
MQLVKRTCPKEEGDLLVLVITHRLRVAKTPTLFLSAFLYATVGFQLMMSRDYVFNVLVI